VTIENMKEAIETVAERGIESVNVKTSDLTMIMGHIENKAETIRKMALTIAHKNTELSSLMMENIMKPSRLDQYV